MNKFLKLVEETDPANNNSVYVISIKGPGGSLEDIQISGDEYALYLHDQIGKLVRGEIDFTPVEDQEEELSDEDQAVIDDTEEAARLGHRGAVIAVRQANQKKARETASKVNRYNQLN